ncbi:MAG: hypothetical protein CL927_05695 [Deltaproteobacteria bacterium]|nr:hypothetical protein [Deltaproteobacteria bacterium]HCH62934.1 hypothetical protein [Deltaproteobacteria bacterium]
MSALDTAAAEARLLEIQQHIGSLGAAPSAGQALDGWMEAAALSLVLGRLDLARAALGDARRALESAGRPVDEARVLLQWARVENKAGDADLAERMLSAAAGLAEQGGDHGVQARALGELAGRRVARGDHEGAASLYQTASVLCDEVGNPADLLQHVMGAATALQLSGAAGRAFDLLSAALDHIRPDAGDGVPWRPVLYARAMAVSLGREAGVPGADNEALEGILSDAEELGERAVAGWIRFEASKWAAQAGRRNEAVKLAEAARSDALAARDSALYLQSALLSAHFFEVDGHDAGVLKMLHTARGTLGDLLGDEGQRPVLEVIRATHERWGDDRYEAARTMLAGMD